MKFAHLADCHIGCWREPKLRELGMLAFDKAISTCLKEKIDFMLISGDLFNTSLPAIEQLRQVVVRLKELKDENIPVYIIAGSHDFSPSGKTMLDVLDSAGLVKNVVRGDVRDEKLILKFTKDKKTGAKIVGMLGKKGMLEKSYYEDLDRKSLTAEKGFKIFMLHSALTELKPKELEKMDSMGISMLPKGFDYYAAGHVHVRMEKDMEGYGTVVYPGPLFPNNQSEIEKLGYGGFYIYNDGKLSFNKIELVKTLSKEFDCNNKTIEKIDDELREFIKDNDYKETIVTLRFSGMLKTGRISELDFKSIIERFEEKGAFFVMRNTAKVTSREFEEIKVSDDNVDELEARLIKEHAGNLPDVSVETEKEMIKNLMSALNAEKHEGERVIDFESRVKGDGKSVLSMKTEDEDE